MSIEETVNCYLLIKSLRKLDFRTAALIGVFQVIAAVFPGTSRSGATVVGALLTRPVESCRGVWTGN